MKNSVVLFLLSIFLFHSVGFTLLFESAEQLNKMVVTENIHNSKLETVILSKTEYKIAAVNKNEIRWNGKRYDIASVQFLNDKVYLKCFHDEKEENIFGMLSEHIERYVKDASSNSKSKSATLLKSLTKDYLPFSSTCYNVDILLVSRSLFYTTTAKQLLGFTSILAPPPKRIV